MTLIVRGGTVEGGAKTGQGATAHAEGRETQAAGVNAHAEGYATLATASHSHSEGFQTNVVAAATYAHAEGAYTRCDGQAAHAEGYGSTAPGSYSHSGGYYGKANGVASFVQGFPGGSASLYAQCGIYGLQAYTTVANTTATMSINGGAPYTTAANNVLIPTYSNFAFDVSITARKAGTSGASAAWRYAGLAARDSGNARLVGTITSLGVWSDATIGSVTISVDSVNQILSIVVTPNSATATNWQAVVITNEMSMSS